jgi:hypothetical protein
MITAGYGGDPVGKGHLKEVYGNIPHLSPPYRGMRTSVWAKYNTVGRTA